MAINRAGRRKLKKENREAEKAKFSLIDVQKAITMAIEMKNLSNGHLYKSILKEHCVFCGADTSDEKECEYWFMTFMDRMQTILINPEFFTNENEIQAVFVQHGYEYDDIVVRYDKTPPAKLKEVKDEEA